MNPPAPRRLYLLFEFVPQAVSVIAVAVGALVLIGWVFDVGTLKSVLPGLVIMKANTATAFVLSGVALWGIATGSQNRTLQISTQACSGVVLLLGLLTLGEYLSGADLGIDQLLFREVTSLPGDIPGRMAVNTALSFAALGAALLLLGLGKGGMVVAIHALAIVPIIAAGSALIGYGYNIDELLREKLNYTPMSLHAATVFVLLAFGVMNARADYPFRRFLTSTNPAGLIVRRLLPAAIGFTLVAGWLILRGYYIGYFSAAFALALFTAGSIAGLGAMILWIARTVYRAEVQRERMEESLRSASQYARSLIEASLDPLVTISAGGKITDVNEATVRATGVAREAMIGRDFSDYFTEPDKARAGYQEVFAKGFVTDYPLSLQHVSGKVMEVLYNASVYRNAKGEVAGVFAAARDITERKKNDAANASRLHLLQFAQTHSLDELLEETINEAERLTGSLIGFYHFVEEDQNSLTLQTWSTRTKAEFCKAEGKGLHYPIADAGVWADCVRQGKPVIHNDYATLPNRKGMPEGHATVIRELVVPVRRGNKLSAILGVGNKPSDYAESDVETVLLIADLTGEIAARKRAEDALRKSSVLLNSTQRLSKIGGWEFDVATGRSIWTEELYRLHEMPADSNIDHVGESLKCYSPEDRTIISDAFKSAAEKGEAYDLEFPFTTFKGRAIWIRTTGEPVYENGKVVRVIGNLMDISERKRAEASLRASEALFRALANATSEGMLIHEQGRIVEANRQMEDILSRPHAEIVGASVVDFVAPAWRDRMRRLVQTPEDTRVEIAFVRPNGSEVIVSGLAYPCVYLGRPMRVAVYRDITLEKRADEALRNVGVYNRSLIEVSLDPLVTISPEGKITDMNEATVQATGMPRSLLIGSDFSNYFTEPDKARAGYQEVFAKGFVTDYPLSLQHVSGKVMEVLYNASVYRNAKGEVAGIFAAARDITERKRAEDELRHYHEHLEELVRERTSKLNAVNKDLEEFIYSMAHDLGIPLRAVNGFAHILLTEYRDKLDDEGKRYLDVVQDNTRRMGRLIDDILAFSRLRSAEITVSKINMEELVHEGLDELRPTFAGRELNVEIKPLRSARGDRTMLRQVWVNLLSNAIKFTREKSAARIEVGCVVEETELVYYVKDNGAGFDMQYANKLFGVFQRLHGVEEFEGRGIGLAMVKRIVTRHGGRVWAEGKLNEGATIYFALPAKEQEHG